MNLLAYTLFTFPLLNILEIIVLFFQMVTARLSCEDAKAKGWLLDGYPRSSAQAESLEKLKIRPDVYVVLDVRRLHVDVNFTYDLIIV